MQNASKGAILQVTTKNSNINAATLQALQHTIVVVVVERPEAVQNNQNNEITTIHDIPPICSMVNVV